VAFVAHGFSACVVLIDSELPSAASELVAYSTETREAHEDAAATKVAVACRLFRQSHIPILFKKIDSTLRGPYAAELAVLMQELGITKATLNPAFPEQGRIVEEGEVFVVGSGGERRFVARIADLSGVEVADALSREDLDAIVARVFDAADLPLICGSGGIALSVAAILARRCNRLPASAPKPQLNSGSPLLFIGTDHPTTEAQVLHLRNRGLVEEQPLRDMGSPTGKRPVLVCADWSAPLDFRPLEAAMAAGRYGALILSGGSTARTLLEALGAGRIHLLGQFGPGLPWGRIGGGIADGRLVAVKSGGFGGNDTLEMILRQFLPADNSK
jgi:uncharacterized protein YgbK (DUF1537 family)